ncbi:MAG: hypothetical protein IT384_25125 [Deltaproteobacteria bacterium]|nr:hypothetical protein [Deltaproteobacteria bacterium]
MWSAKYAECFGGSPEDWEADPSYCLLSSQAVAAGRQRFDPAAASACLRSVEGASCEETFGDLSANLSCGIVFEGLANAGEGCAGAGAKDCPRGFLCDRSSGSDACSRTCVQASWIARGESCAHANGRSVSCAPGLFCSPSRICVPRPRLGESCRDSSCAEGVCNVATRRCEPQRPAGSTCSEAFPDGCAGYDVACMPIPLGGGVCRATLRLREICQPGLVQCGWPMVCAAQPDGVARCQRPPRRGERCDESAPEVVSCGDASYCSHTTAPGVCVERTPTGSPCQEGDTCAELLCVDGVCADRERCPSPPKDLGVHAAFGG